MCIDFKHSAILCIMLVVAIKVNAYEIWRMTVSGYYKGWFCLKPGTVITHDTIHRITMITSAFSEVLKDIL